MQPSQPLSCQFILAEMCSFIIPSQNRKIIKVLITIIPSEKMGKQEIYSMVDSRI